MSNSIEKNLSDLVDVQTTALSVLKNRGDVTVPQNACLADVPQMISQLTNRITIRTAVDGLTKGGTATTRFAVCSDVHIKGDGKDTADVRAVTMFTRLGEMYKNGELDFVVCCGDLITEEGPSYNRYIEIKSSVDNWKTLLQGCPLYCISGNHDTIEKGDDGVTAFAKVTGQTDKTVFTPSEKVFKIEKNGDVFLFYGGFGKRWSAKDSINTEEERSWIISQLNEYSDRGRVFMFTHFYYPLDAFGYRYTAGVYIDNSGDEYDLKRQYETIAKTYKNLIWISGHSHTAWKQESVYPTIKAHSNESARLIACPSLMQKDNNEYMLVTCYNDMVKIDGINNETGEAYSYANYFVPKAVENSFVYYAVKQNLQGLTTSYNGTRVIEGSNITIKLALKEFYSNPSITVLVDGRDVTNAVLNTETLTISITNVTGDITVTATATASGMATITTNLKGYAYSGAELVRLNTAFSAKLTLLENYADGAIKVTMGGTDITATALKGYDISVDNVTADINISATALNIYKIVQTLDEGITTSLGATAIEGTSINAELTNTTGEELKVSVLMGGVDITETAYKDGKITIAKVTGDISFVAMIDSIDYSEYVQMWVTPTSNTEVTPICNAMTSVQTVYIDDVEVDKSTLTADSNGNMGIIFSDTSEHKVCIKNVDNKVHTAQFKPCQMRKLVIPSYYVTLGGGSTTNASFSSASLEEADVDPAQTIGGYTFYNCAKLKKLSLGENVQNIGNYALNGSTAVNEIHWRGIKAVTLANYALSGLNDNAGTFYYSAGADISSWQGKLSKWAFKEK